MSYIDGNGLNAIWKKIKTLYSPLSHTHSPSDLTSAVPVIKGGTGAATVAAARENLGVASADHDHAAAHDLWMEEDDVNGLWYGENGSKASDSVESAMRSLSNKIVEVSTVGYTLPTATSDVLGGVKVGGNITNTDGTISLSKNNVTSALGYTPPTEKANELVRSYGSSTNTFYLAGSMQDGNSTSSLYKNSDLRFDPKSKTLLCSNVRTTGSIDGSMLSAATVVCHDLVKDDVFLGATLFEGDESGLGTYDLKDTISNFNYLKIYFVTDAGVSFSSEVYCGRDPGPIIAWLTAFDFDEGSGFIRYIYKKIVLTEAAIDVESGYELNYVLDSNNNFEISGKEDGIRIRKIIGS